MKLEKLTREPEYKRATTSELLALAVTPVWTKESGNRLKLARMRMMIDQRTLGRLFQVSQRTISEIETGRREVVKTLSLARVQAMLGKHAGYVLIGSNADAYSAAAIKIRYWEKFGPGKKKSEF